MIRRMFLFTLVIYIIHLLLFAFYRIAFISLLIPTIQISEVQNILLRGMRFDIIFIGVEISIVILFGLLWGKINIRKSILFWGFTFLLHALFLSANLQFFQERNQQLGESLAAYLTSPKEIYIAIFPIVQQHPILIFFTICFLTGIIYGLWKKSLPWKGKNIILWSRSIPKETSNPVWMTSPAWLNMTSLVITLLFAILPMFEIITTKKQELSWGWKIVLCDSKHYTDLDDFLKNQAIINPCQEFWQNDFPQIFITQFPSKLRPEEAIQIAKESLGIQSLPEYTQYPLLQKIDSSIQLGIENIVLLQVEGLSQSLIDKEVDGKLVVPYLHHLSQEGVYFPNGIQAFNATIGSFFAVVSSMHKAAFDAKTQAITNQEATGFFASLPHILENQNYRAIFAQGFRQNYHDFISLMGNCDYQSIHYYDILDRLQKKGLAEKADESMGIFDHYFLEECATLLASSHEKLIAHLVTITSHSPWTIPQGVQTPFEKRHLAAFYYTDNSIQKWMEKLQQLNPSQFQKTLFVIFADHTSVIFSTDQLERIRIPLIFYSPAFAPWQAKPKGPQENVLFSHVDIIPTILYLLGGQHWYAGLGKNLFAPESAFYGALGNTRSSGFYWKKNILLEYFANQDSIQAWYIENGKASRKLTEAELQSENCQRLLLEYTAQMEASRHLIQKNLVWPRLQQK